MMQGTLCSGCGTLNTGTTKFCIECGTPMAVASAPAEPRQGALFALPAAWQDSELVGRLGRSVLVPIGIFVVTFALYYLSARGLFPFGFFGETASASGWYKHYVFLADAMLNGKLDVASSGIPDYYQDVVPVGSEKYLPFPPVPAVLLMPFVAIWGTGTQEYIVSMLFGAINVVIFWYVLRALKVSTLTQMLIVPFFAFGTVHFYAATTGTVWFFAHVAAVMFLLLAILTLLRGMNPIIPAIFLGLAFLSRQTTILAAPFFLYVLYSRFNDQPLNIESLKAAVKDRRTLANVGLFCAPLIGFVILSFVYNYARFDSFSETGYQTVYESYAGNQYAYWQATSPGVAPGPVPAPPRFGLFDPRNIPLHIHAMFMITPNFYPDWSIFRPSPYGMSALLTSSPFVFAFLVKRKTELKLAAWLAIVLISVPIFLHYSQGWVQYGYRFLLDFAPFLLVLTALGFDDNASPTGRRWQIALVTISIIAGFWGRYWANQFGW
jgi:hypothetical protein